MHASGTNICHSPSTMYRVPCTVYRLSFAMLPFDIDNQFNSARKLLHFALLIAEQFVVVAVFVSRVVSCLVLFVFFLASVFIYNYFNFILIQFLSLPLPALLLSLSCMHIKVGDLIASRELRFAWRIVSFL